MWSRTGMTSGEGPMWINLAYVDQSDHHFRRSNHAARCFRLHQGCHAFAQHSGKLPLCFSPACRWMPPLTCVFSQENHLTGAYVKIARRSGFSLPGLLTCARVLPLIWVCLCTLGLTQAAGLFVVFRFLWAQATRTASGVFAVSKWKC